MGKQEYILRSEAGEASINFARLIKKRMTSSIRLAPWSRAKERYERTYNDDKGNIAANVALMFVEELV